MKFWLELIFHIVAILFSPITLLRVISACLAKANNWAKSIIDEYIDRHTL